ncbi:MAG: tetratricopeptide repeat protein [Desulfovibrio sp.]|nr:tetratricopeptide repeat protein [Desulfovibrio sp.]
MRHPHILLLIALLSLTIPATAAALTKNEIRERSLKRLDRAGETIRAQGQQEQTGTPFGRPPQTDNEAPPAPRRPSGAKAAHGRAAERRLDEAVIVPAGGMKTLPGDTGQTAVSKTPGAPVPPPPAPSPASPSQPGSQPAPDSLAAPPPEDRQRALTLFRQALAAADANDHRKALKLLDSAINLDPGDPDFFNNRGNTHNSLGNPKKALEDYAKAISLKPKDPAYLCNRGVVFEQLGDDASACRDYRAACELGDCDFYHSFKKEGRCQK